MSPSSNNVYSLVHLGNSATAVAKLFHQLHRTDPRVFILLNYSRGRRMCIITCSQSATPPLHLKRMGNFASDCAPRVVSNEAKNCCTSVIFLSPSTAAKAYHQGELQKLHHPKISTQANPTSISQCEIIPLQHSFRFAVIFQPPFWPPYICI